MMWDMWAHRVDFRRISLHSGNHDKVAMSYHHGLIISSPELSFSLSDCSHHFVFAPCILRIYRVFSLLRRGYYDHSVRLSMSSLLLGIPKAEKRKITSAEQSAYVLVVAHQLSVLNVYDNTLSNNVEIIQLIYLLYMASSVSRTTGLISV